MQFKTYLDKKPHPSGTRPLYTHKNLKPFGQAPHMFRIEVLLCGSRRLLRFQFDFLICGNTEKITLQNSIPTLLQNKIVAADTRRNNNSAPEFAFVVPDKR
jgi:hypothetical protein